MVRPEYMPPAAPTSGAGKRAVRMPWLHPGISPSRPPERPRSPSWLPSTMKSGISRHATPNQYRCASYWASVRFHSLPRLSVMKVSPRSTRKSAFSSRMFSSVRR